MIGKLADRLVSRIVPNTVAHGSGWFKQCKCPFCVVWYRWCNPTACDPWIMGDTVCQVCDSTPRPC